MNKRRRVASKIFKICNYKLAFSAQQRGKNAQMPPQQQEPNETYYLINLVLGKNICADL